MDWFRNPFRRKRLPVRLDLQMVLETEVCGICQAPLLGAPNPKFRQVSPVFAIAWCSDDCHLAIQSGVRPAIIRVILT